MTLPVGWNFRSTSGFVTDPTGTFFNGSVNSASGTDGGVAWAWTIPFSLQTRDRSATVSDKRLAGVTFQSNDGNQSKFTVTLPAAGDYVVNLALGDQGNPETHYCEILDGTTLLATIANGVATTADHYIDANGTTKDAATWASENPVGGGGAGGRTFTFSTTSLVVRIGSSTAQSGQTCLVALSVSEPAASGATGTGASTIADFISDASGQSGTGATGTGDSTIADFTSDAAGSPTDTGSGASTVGDFTSAASGAASTTITTAPFKNNTGTVLASTTIDLVAALSLTDLSVVASWTAQTTDADGILTLTDAALVSGTSYLVVTSSSDGTAAGARKYTAA